MRMSVHARDRQVLDVGEIRRQESRCRMKRQYLRVSMLIIFEISGLALFAGCGDSSAPMLNGPSTTSLSIMFAPFSNNCSGVRCVQIGGMEQFSVSVSCAIGVTCPLASSQGFAWSVAGTGCSGASCGTIDATGKYTAPATVPNPAAVVTVTASSVVDSTKFALDDAIVTVLGESFFSVNPTSVEFGNQMVNTTSAPRAVTVTNTGSTPQPVRGRMNGRQVNGKTSLTQTIARRCLPWVPAAHSTSLSGPVLQVAGAPTLVVDGIFEEEGFVNLGGTGTN